MALSALNGPPPKILILGSSGWFGSSAMNLVGKTNSIIMLRNSSGNLVINNGRLSQVSPRFKSCVDFEPTIVFDCAFLTRDKVSILGTEKYVQQNNLLIEQALSLQAQNSVERFIAISSGAAVPHLGSGTFDLENDPYGALKAKYEIELMGSNHKLKENVVLLRAWSMSGRYAKNWSMYAFFDLIRQSRTSEMNILADSLVFRRYADVEDLLRLGLESKTGEIPIDSGGPLLEIEELAYTIRKVLDSKAVIIRNSHPIGEDHYHSDGQSWDRAVAESGIETKSIRDQILYSSGLHYLR